MDFRILIQQSLKPTKIVDMLMIRKMENVSQINGLRVYYS